MFRFPTPCICSLITTVLVGILVVHLRRQTSSVSTDSFSSYYAGSSYPSHFTPRSGAARPKANAENAYLHSGRQPPLRRRSASKGGSISSTSSIVTSKPDRAPPTAATCPLFTWKDVKSFTRRSPISVPRNDTSAKFVKHGTKSSQERRPEFNTTKHIIRKRKRAIPEEFDPAHPPSADDGLFQSYGDEWRESYTRGLRLWDELQQALQHPQPHICPTFGPGWTITRHTTQRFTQAFLDECIRPGLLNAVDRAENPGRLPRAGAKICSDTYDQIVHTTRQDLPSNVCNLFWFQNWYSPAARAIFIDDSIDQIDPEEFYPPSTRPQGEVDQCDWPQSPYSWAQVAFATWSNLCSRRGELPSLLRYVGVMKASDELTQETIASAYENDLDGTEAVPDGETIIYRRDFTTDDAHFYAIIGTPDGANVARLLATYSNPFATRGSPGDGNQITKVKTVGRISVLSQLAICVDNTDILFILDDVDPPPGFHQTPGTPASPPPATSPRSRLP